MRINYKEKKLLEEKEVNLEEVEFAVKETSLDLDSAILSTEKELTSKKGKLETLKSTYPLDIQSCCVFSQGIETLNKGLKILKALKEELGL